MSVGQCPKPAGMVNTKQSTDAQWKADGRVRASKPTVNATKSSSKRLGK